MNESEKNMEINIINETNYCINEEITQLIHKIAEKTKEILKLKEAYIVSTIFVDPKQIHEINLQYRNIDKPTDVISFALMDEALTYLNQEAQQELGDIFINVEAIKQQAIQYGHSEQRELCFLFGHGLLHLLGYDHKTKEEETAMFQLQEEIIDEIIPRNL